MTDKILEENTAPLVGQILKDTRLAQGLTLDTVAEVLRISKRHLLHLEENHENLVCDVYTLGFLRAYAQYLGLDAKGLSQKFKEQAAQSHPSYSAFPVSLPQQGRPSLRILSFSLIGLLVIIIGWQWFAADRFTPPSYEQTASVEETPSPLPLQPTLPVSSGEETVSSLETPSTPLGLPATTHLKVMEEAWVEVKDQEGRVLLNRLLNPGDSYQFNNPQNLVLKTGNARGIQLISDKKSLTFSEKVGTVKSDIPLDPEKWVEEKPETP